MYVTMTSLKGWSLLPFTAFLLLSIAPTVTEVVNSMSDCDQFLLEGTPPQVPGVLEDGEILNQNRYKPICQTFENNRRFVTLYDTENKIPVFSAYKYRGKGGTRPKTNWKIEPQLEERNTDNMRDDKYRYQACNNDYKGNDTGYNRGHLFPSSHALHESDQKSTFTLTNIVPQAVTFNNGRWKNMESCVRCILDKYCLNNNNHIEGFVVTGAQPSQNNQLNNRVNIPSTLWSAFCCYSNNKTKWLASAHWGDNDQRSVEYMETKTLAELHQNLSTVDSRFEMFPRTQCPLHETVAELYPEIKEDTNCKCPPQASTTSAPKTTTAATPTASIPILTNTDTTTANQCLPLLNVFLRATNCLTSCYQEVLPWVDDRVQQCSKKYFRKLQNILQQAAAAASSALQKCIGKKMNAPSWPHVSLDSMRIPPRIH